MGLFVFFGTAFHNLNLKDQRLDLKTIELQDTGAKLKTLETRYEDLNTQLNKELEHKEKNSEKIKQLEEDRKKLEQEKIDLQNQLQAKAQEREKLAAGRVAAASAIPADKEAILAAAGVPQSEWWAADWLINKESSWNARAINASSGACGLVQALPCSKLPCSLDDPVCQVKWQLGYVNNRYGGYAGAVSFHKANNWY